MNSSSWLSQLLDQRPLRRSFFIEETAPKHQSHTPEIRDSIQLSFRFKKLTIVDEMSERSEPNAWMEQ